MARYPFVLRFMLTYVVILLPPILLAVFIYVRTTAARRFARTGR